MGLPIATTAGGVCFAFPDIVNTPAGPASVPVPYPNVAQLQDAEDTSSKVKVAGAAVVLKRSKIKRSSGDEAGTLGPNKGQTTFTSASSKVKINGEFVVRMTDTTSQNGGNATGMVLGGNPKVLCG